MRMCANHPESPAIAYCRTCGKPLCEACRIESFGAAYCSAHGPNLNPVQPAAPAVSPNPPSAPGPPDPADARPASGFAGSPYTTAASVSGQAAPPYTSAAANATAAAPPYSFGSSPYTAPVSPYSGPATVRSDGSPAWALLLGTIPGVGAIYNGQYAKGLIHAIIFGLLITVVSNGHNDSLAPLVGLLIGVWWFYMVLEAFHTARRRRGGLPVDEFSSLLNVHGSRVGLPLGAIVLIGLGALLLLNTSGLLPIERIIRYWPVSLILLGLYMLYNRIENRGHATGARELRNEPR